MSTATTEETSPAAMAAFVWFVQSYGPTMLLCGCGTELHNDATAQYLHEREWHSPEHPAVYEKVPVTPAMFATGETARA